ncbi:serine/threonine-protein kinase 19-like isoform X3 [Triticum dicoccoides]|uniref:serine/threonine-protein kinase 19-like isoform X3 n=1 Tax=Triticum dicoccoides TaxID=85692 RepID=UPI00188F55F0|nr:serine/threonine-protein kinase 19-like isoform X3 [Triticum dicoccoides]
MAEPWPPYSSSSRGKKKRPRSPIDDATSSQGRTENSTSLEDNLMFSDTLIALQLMRTQFPKLEKSLKKDRVLRVFKLNTGQDDHAIMFMDDYLKQMESAVRRSTGKNKDGSEVFDWFEKYVLRSKLDVSIDHLELLLSHGGDARDKHITLLMNAGLLTRQLIDPNMYWFSIPSIGPILKGLSQGRKEVLSLLNRRKYKEMLLSSLEKTRLRLSPLDVRFHPVAEPARECSPGKT